MERFLFFDTETTGLPRGDKSAVEDLDCWPRLVQISWILTDGRGRFIEEENKYIIPDGFTIPDDASQIHGISTEFAQKHGENLENVLLLFEKSLVKADMLVCHNVNYDLNVVLGEFMRRGIDTCVLSKDRYCTMVEGTELCAIPYSRDDKDGYKWPKLIELYSFLFGEGFDGAHDALNDVKAVVKCFFEMKKRERIEKE